MNNVKMKTIVTRHHKQGVGDQEGGAQEAGSQGLCQDRGGAQAGGAQAGGAGAQAGGAGAQAGDAQRASSAGAQARGRQQKASSAGAQARGRPQRASSATPSKRPPPQAKCPSKVHKTRGRHPKQRAEGGPRRARRQKQVWFTARGRQGCCMACQGGPQASAGGAAGPREAATAAPP